MTVSQDQFFPVECLAQTRMAEHCTLSLKARANTNVSYAEPWCMSDSSVCQRQIPGCFVTPSHPESFEGYLNCFSIFFV